MSLTRDFKETIKARIDHGPAFREELLEEGVECLLSGDLETGKEVLRTYINATIGFQELGSLTEKSPKRSYEGRCAVGATVPSFPT